VQSFRNTKPGGPAAGRKSGQEYITEVSRLDRQRFLVSVLAGIQVGMTGQSGDSLNVRTIGIACESECWMLRRAESEWYVVKQQDPAYRIVAAAMETRFGFLRAKWRF